MKTIRKILVPAGVVLGLVLIAAYCLSGQYTYQDSVDVHDEAFAVLQAVDSVQTIVDESYALALTREEEAESARLACNDPVQLALGDAAMADARTKLALYEDPDSDPTTPFNLSQLAQQNIAKGLAEINYGDIKQALSLYDQAVAHYYSAGDGYWWTAGIGLDVAANHLIGDQSLPSPDDKGAAQLFQDAETEYTGGMGGM